MTEFNPTDEKNPDYGEILGKTLGITDEDDARQYKESYIRFIIPQVQKDHSKEILSFYKKGRKVDVNSFIRAKAEEIVNNNIAYFAGYCNKEVRERVERLFICSHPIFGGITKNGQPTAEESMWLGYKYAQKKME